MSTNMKAKFVCALLIAYIGCQDDKSDKATIASLRAENAALQKKVSGCAQAVVSSLGSANQPQPSLVAEFPGVFGVLAKGYTHAEALEIMGAIMSATRQRSFIMSRTLGYEILNTQGKIDLGMMALLIRDFRRMAFKRFGKATALRVLRNQWGNLAGSAIYYASEESLESAIR